MRLRMSVLSIGALVATLLPAAPAMAACAAPGGASIPEPASPEGEVVFTGGGLGHGLGLSQYGANGAAALGCDHTTILETYYPGASVTNVAGANEVVVGLIDPSHQSARGRSAIIEITVTAKSSLGAAAVSWEVTGCADAASCENQPPAQKPGETWHMAPTSDGQFRFYRVEGGARASASFWTGGQVGALLVAHHDRTVVTVRPLINNVPVNARTTRWGQIELMTTGKTIGADISTSYARARVTAGRDINGTAQYQGLDRYLWGLGEVPSSFEPAAQRAQAIAARTYALKRISTGLRSACRCHVVTTSADQHWTAWSKEYEDLTKTAGIWREQVLATQRNVMAKSGTLIDALYSSSHGGQSESPAYVWHAGKTSYVGPSYLSPVDDSRWELGTDTTSWKNPHRSWSSALTFAQLTTKLNTYGSRPYQGTFQTVTNISVASPIGSTTRRDGIRVTGVKSGNSVTETWDGWDIRQALSLKSPNFTISVIQDLSAGTPLAGDWDGDGDDDAGWYLDGKVALRLGDGNVHRYQYGRAGDTPIVGDFDGDGDDTVSIIRDRTWHLTHDLDGGAADQSFVYGRLTAGDLPLAGDWDGSGRDGIGIVRRGDWHLRNALGGGAAQATFVYGRVLAGDVPVVGDWQNVGSDRIGIVRGDEWHLRYELTGGTADRTMKFGAAARGDRPVPGDWDGDGDDTNGIVRGTTWHVRDDLRGGAARTFTFAG
jgi:SpoIID/LytB domain protein